MGHSAKGAPRVLGARVDALTVAFQGEVRAAVAVELRAAARRASVGRQPVAVDLGGGVALNVNPRSRDGWWHLSSKDVALVVDLDATGGWRVEARPRAVLLARVTPLEAFGMCRALADLVLEAQGDLLEAGAVAPSPARVRRVDLCADLVGFAVDDIAREAWVAPRRLRAKQWGTLASYSAGARTTGFSLGSGDVAARIYDKTEELDLPQNAGDKREGEHDRWRAQGWDGQELVTRVEFQVRGQALDQFDMRDPAVLLARLDDLWTYLARERATRDRTPWVRLVVPDAGEARRDRWKLDARWVAVQGVRFVREAPPAVRTYRRAPPKAVRAVSMLLSLEAAGYAHKGETVTEAREKTKDPIEDWAPERAREYVGEAIGSMGMVLAFMQAQGEWTADLIRDRGEQGAARYVFERRRAARAHERSLQAVLVDRFERAGLASTSTRERREERAA